MSNPSHHIEPATYPFLQIGPRGYDIMALLWERGPATVRELHTWLIADEPLAYMTVLTICVRLVEKGLLDRHQPAQEGKPPSSRTAYVFTPRVSAEEFARAAVGQRILELLTRAPAIVEPQAAELATAPHSNRTSDRAAIERLLAYLGTLRDPSGQRVDDTTLDTIVALLERAETAERRGATFERRAGTATTRASKKRGKVSAPVEEHRGRVCRVCGQFAPPQNAARHDDLRVCHNEACRAEARRRDNLTKQRRFQERRRAQQQLEQTVASYIAGNV